MLNAEEARSKQNTINRSEEVLLAEIDNLISLNVKKGFIHMKGKLPTLVKNQLNTMGYKVTYYREKTCIRWQI